MDLDKKALVLVLSYTALIGVGMFVMHHIAGYSYSRPEMVNVLWWVEVLLTTLTIIVVLRWYGWSSVGFVKLEKKSLPWLLPMLAIIIYNWLRFAQVVDFSPAQWRLFSLVGFTTALVGFSEELVYRGVVLHSFLKSKIGWQAVIISSLLFSLLHSVNVFGGLSFSHMLSQLVLTFVFGLYASLIALKIKNIWPLILFHWQWDFNLIGGGMALKASPVFLVIVVELLTIIILGAQLLKSSKQTN